MLLSYPSDSVWQQCLEVVLFGVMVQVLCGVASFLDCPLWGLKTLKGSEFCFVLRVI